MSTQNRYFTRIFRDAITDAADWQECEKQINFPYASDIHGIVYPLLNGDEFTPNRVNELVLGEDFTYDGKRIVDGVVTDELV